MATYVVTKHPRGVSLAELVEYKGDVAVVKRLKGQRFRLSNPKTFGPVEIPRSHVLREATPRELTLGHPT